jgi:hypothetical protein
MVRHGMHQVSQKGFPAAPLMLNLFSNFYWYAKTDRHTSSAE